MTSGARPSHDRDLGRKREKGRRSERPRKRERGACLAGNGDNGGRQRKSSVGLSPKTATSHVNRGLGGYGFEPQVSKTTENHATGDGGSIVGARHDSGDH